MGRAKKVSKKEKERDASCLLLGAGGLSGLASCHFRTGWCFAVWHMVRWVMFDIFMHKRRWFIMSSYVQVLSMAKAVFKTIADITRQDIGNLKKKRTIVSAKELLKSNRLMPIQYRYMSQQTRTGTWLDHHICRR